MMIDAFNNQNDNINIKDDKRNDDADGVMMIMTIMVIMILMNHEGKYLKTQSNESLNCQTLLAGPQKEEEGEQQEEKEEEKE